MEEWFSLADSRSKRAAIAGLVRRLSQEQHRGRTVLWPEIGFDDATQMQGSPKEVEVVQQINTESSSSGAATSCAPPNAEVEWLKVRARQTFGRKGYSEAVKTQKNSVNIMITHFIDPEEGREEINAVAGVRDILRELETV